MHSQTFPMRINECSEGDPSEPRDCHQGKQAIPFNLLQASDLQLLRPQQDSNLQPTD
jgi:hypothetical protein